MTTRVLFVDDEPRVLDGLRLGLRAQRKTWEMVFVDGAPAALAEIGARPVDVVVSDMRMPGMSGAELLAKVAVLRPSAVRIVLSGQMDESAAVRAASVAHRFLTKPCESATLVATITQALELHSWLRSDHLRSKLGGVDTLPALPHVCISLDRALADSDVSVAAVAKIIEGDPGIAAKVLQLVNSSFFGLPRTMVNVAQAVSYLGISTMKSLTLADSLFHELGKADLAAVKREQERSLLRARVARRLFNDAKKADTASTAALLLDIGSLALRSRIPAEYAATVHEATERGLPLEQVEQERLEVTHADVGAYLLGLWGLPHEIIAAVATHHAPITDLTVLDTSSAARISDALVSEVLATRGGTAAAPLPTAVLDALGIGATINRLRTEIAASLDGGE
jgi:HD-like signal output (HDOD) protein/CheY-like chemotaxis protein